MTIRSSIVLSLLVLVSPTVSAADEKPNLCKDTEQIVFSCAVSEKVVSLCATLKLTAQSGRLTYRFGFLGSTPELTYPMDDINPSSAFSNYYENWAKGSYNEVTFKRGIYRYTVYNRKAAYEAEERSNGGGVKIFKSGRLVADILCEDDTINDNFWDALHGAGLPVTPDP